MKKLWNNSIFKILVAILLIMLGLLIYTSTINGYGISTLVSFITTPLQKVSTKVSNAVENLTANKKNTDELEAKIEELNKEIEKLRSLTVDYYDIKRENMQFLKYYDLKQKNKSFKFASANVVGRDPNENYYAFTLDQGKISGISVNDPVITDQGLIGWVYHVDLNSCKVRTILSPNTKVGAIDKISGDSGVITGGMISMADQNLTKLTLISTQNSIKTDDIVVTTGLSGIYPVDLKIGQIKEISTDTYDASVYAVVEPFEDIRNVKSVFIVTDFVGKGNVSNSSLSEFVTEENPNDSK